MDLNWARMIAARLGWPGLAETLRDGASKSQQRRLRRRGALALAVTFLMALAALLVRSGRAGAGQASPAAPPTIGLQPLASGLGSITSITNARDSRLFLTIQSGQIKIYSGGAVLPTPFLDVSTLISCCSERGLLSVAFHPLYAANGYLFLYTTNTNGDIEIVRYQRMASDANRADPTTRAILLTIPHPTNANHNGGQLQFGPDGYLYIGTGDGGSGNDPPCNAQNDAVALGKMLRIDVDQNVGVSPFYGIPASNPFAGSPFPRNLFWAKGLRNPFRFSFDRATGDFWIGDVGQGAREEVDFQPQSSAGGQNYGWKVMEGSICGTDGSNGCSSVPPACGDASYTLPVYEYDHGFGCAIIGGYVYRGSQDLNLYGTYLYGDECSGNLWGNGQLLTPTLPGLQTFGEDSVGEIYLGTGGGGLYRLTHPGQPAPDSHALGAAVFHGAPVPGAGHARRGGSLRRSAAFGRSNPDVRVRGPVRDSNGREVGVGQYRGRQRDQRPRLPDPDGGRLAAAACFDDQLQRGEDPRQQRDRAAGASRARPRCSAARGPERPTWS